MMAERRPRDAKTEDRLRDRAVLWTVVVASFLAGCDDGDRGEVPTGEIWVRYAVERELGQGVTAYAAFRDGSAEGEPVELEEGAVVTCNGSRLDLVVEAWTMDTYYRASVVDAGEGGSYDFSLRRASGEATGGVVTLPSEVTVEGSGTDDDVQPGRDVAVALSAGEAEELQVDLVAECLAPVSVTLAGDAESATVPGDQVRCACEAGGLVPPCDGTIRAQRIDRGPPDPAFAGGECVGVQRHELPVEVIE
jgi:hypothetical protein